MRGVERFRRRAGRRRAPVAAAAAVARAHGLRDARARGGGWRWAAEASRAAAVPRRAGRRRGRGARGVCARGGMGGSGRDVGLAALRRLFIANRGEISRRVARTAERLGVQAVGAWSAADARAPHALDRARGTNLGGLAAAESYLRADDVVAAAVRHGCGAVHPGYGFLSENEGFADAAEAAGIAWVGPPAAAIRAMGCKQTSKRIMVEADVPVVPGYHGDDQSAERLRAEAEKVGYPVMLKATRGGGGKGMRVVATADDFDGALESAQREAINSFGDGSMILERLVHSPRHVELQVFADSHGNAVYLHERDCSAQRRHQKVLEEAPAPAYLPQSVRIAMGQAAVDAAKAIGYRNAGTVEFLVDGNTGEFFFMEMNTRLQVEHPITEAITGQDLVEWQLRVAMGEELPLTQEQIPLDGHAFEARIYAEKSTPQGFAPSAGTLLRWRQPSSAPGASLVRVDSAVQESGEVSAHYDPMLAKLIVKAATRETALEAMRHALRDFQVAGVHTNIRMLRQLCEQPEVIDGVLTTDFLDNELERVLETDIAGEDARQAAAIAAAASAALAKQHDPAAASRDGGLNGAWAATDSFAAHNASIVGGGSVRLMPADGAPEDTHEHATTTAADSVAVGEWSVDIVSLTSGANGSLNASVRAQAPSGDTLAFDTLVGTPDAAGDRLRVWVWGEEHAEFVSLPPAGVEAASDGVGGVEGTGRIGAHMPGKIASIHAKVGEAVAAGDVLLELEAMKMVHRVCADVDGVIIALAEQDALVKDGELIAHIQAGEK